MIFGKKEEKKIRRNILAIEDDPTYQNFIKKILEKSGHGVSIAANGQEGITLAKEQRPDVIILDEVLPDIRGIDVCKKLKFDETTKDIPVLFLTAGESPADIVEHFEMDAANHLTKPIDAGELISQVEAVFE